MIHRATLRPATLAGNARCFMMDLPMMVPAEAGGNRCRQLLTNVEFGAEGTMSATDGTRPPRRPSHRMARRASSLGGNRNRALRATPSLQFWLSFLQVIAAVTEAEAERRYIVRQDGN
jgi:hypothetical protein